VQQPKLEEEDDDDDDAVYDDDDDDDDDVAAGDNDCDSAAGGPSPSKTRRQTFDGPVLPLDADSTFALPGMNLVFVFVLLLCRS